MASTNFSVYYGSGNSQWKLSLERTSITQSVANNTSTVTYKLYLEAVAPYNTSIYTVQSSYSSDYVSLAGDKDSSCYGKVYKGGTKYTLKTVTKTYTHKSDGTFTTPSITGKIHFGYQNIDATVTLSGEPLNRIARASTFTIPSSGTITKTSSGTVAVSISSASDKFSHKIYYKYSKDDTYTWLTTIPATTNVTNHTYTWSIAASLAKKIPNASSGTWNVKVITYSGSTKIGEATKNITLKVNSTLKPDDVKINSLTEITNYHATYQYYVQGLSKISATISTSPQQSATISSYTLKVGGLSTTGSSATKTLTLTEAGSKNAIGYAKDSRGLESNSGSTTLQIMPYSAPTIKGLSIYRCDASGNADDQGTNIKVTFTGEASSLYNQNQLKVTIKKGTTTIVDSDTVLQTTSGSTTFADATRKQATYSKVILNTLATDTSANFTVELSDNIKKATQTVTIGTAFVLMHFNASGTGIGVGQTYKESVGGTLQVNGRLVVSNNMAVTGANAAGNGRIGMTYVSPNNNVVINTAGQANNGTKTYIYGDTVSLGTNANHISQFYINNTSFGAHFVRSGHDKDNVSVSASSSTSDTVTFTKAGYTPKGIVGTQISNASSSGTNMSNCGIMYCYISSASSGSATVGYRVRNFGSAAAKVKLSFDILWVKDISK